MSRWNENYFYETYYKVGSDKVDELTKHFGDFVVENRDKISDEFRTSTKLNEAYDEEKGEWDLDELNYRARNLVGDGWFDNELNLGNMLKYEMQNIGHTEEDKEHPYNWKGIWVSAWDDKKNRKKVQDNFYWFLVNFEDYHKNR